MINDVTANYLLPLPHQSNTLLEDVDRLRDAITGVDSELHSHGVALGAKADLVAGKVPAAQLPSYVDDVVEVANYAALPVTGEAGKIYVLDTPYTAGGVTSAQFRWSGSAYAPIVASPGTTDAVAEGSTNLYFTAARSHAAQIPATGSALGSIKVGSGLLIDGDGVLSAAAAGGGSGLPAYSDLPITPASNGQTVFTVSGGYTPGNIDIFFNGSLLIGNGDDYTATNGTSFTLTVGVNTVDTLLLRRWAYIPATMAVAKTGDTLTGALNDAATVTLASATTTLISSAASNRVIITGTTTITGLGTVAAGAARTVTFAGVLLLTHNATSLILPSGVNITTAVGDVAEFQSLGAGNWRCTGYMRASGAALVAASSVLPVTLVSTNTTAVAGNHYVFTVGSVTLTIPAGVAGDVIQITNASNTITPVVDFGSAKFRQQSPGAMTLTNIVADMTIKNSGNATYGWV